MVKQRAISEADFNQWPGPQRAIEHDYARRFCALLLTDQGAELAISWRSNGIEPIVIPDLARRLAWVGVDQRVACVRLNGSVVFSIGLDGNLLKIELLPDLVAVLTDISVVMVNPDFSIRRVVDLPDLPIGVEPTDQGYVVRLEDGTNVPL